MMNYNLTGNTVSICSTFDIANRKIGKVKWKMFNQKDKAIERQTKTELEEPTVLQHFREVVNDKGERELQLIDGLEVKFLQIDTMDEHDRYQDMQEYRARMNEDGG